MTNFLPTLLWRPSPNFSSRHGTRVDLLVLHDCEGGYEGSIRWFEMSSRMSRRTTSSARTGVRQRKWSTSPTMLGTHALSIAAPSASRWVASQVAVLTRLCSQLAAHVFAYLCDHLQIPVRHARAGVGSGIASHKDLGPAGSGHHDPSDDPSFMQKFVMVRWHRKGHFPAV